MSLTSPIERHAALPSQKRADLTSVTDTNARANNAYCFSKFIEWNGGNNNTEHLCDECNLGIWRARLQSPFRWSEDLHTSYASLSSS